MDYQGMQHHLWEKIGPDLWQCYWCKGYAKDKLKPDPEAIAKTNPSDCDQVEKIKAEVFDSPLIRKQAD